MSPYLLLALFLDFPIKQNGYSFIYLSLTFWIVPCFSEYLRVTFKSNFVFPVFMPSRTISEQFAARLQEYAPDALVNVLVFCQRPAGLEAALQGLPERNTPKRRQIVAEHYTRALQPVYDFLSDHDLAFVPRNSLLGHLAVTLPVEKIYLLAEQEFVGSIIENQTVIGYDE